MHKFESLKNRPANTHTKKNANQIFFPTKNPVALFQEAFKNGVLPAQCGVILHPLNLILQLLNPTKDVHMLLLQHAKPQFIPQQGHST